MDPAYFGRGFVELSGVELGFALEFEWAIRVSINRALGVVHPHSDL